MTAFFFILTGKSYDDGTQEQMFVFTTPAFDQIETLSPRLEITTSSQVSVDVTISIPGSQIDLNLTVNRNNHSNIVLPQMIRLGIEGKQNKTVIVRSNGMVSVHAMNDGDYGDGFVVYPTSQLEKRYYVAAYSVNTERHPSFVCISAVENTKIIIRKQAAEASSVLLEKYESY